jgi:hypothetical protein
VKPKGFIAIGKGYIERRRSKMSKGYKAFLPVLILSLVLPLVGVIGCAEKATTTEGKPSTSAPVEPNETTITGNLVAARVSSGDYPWEFDIKVYSVSDVLSKKSLIKAEVDQVITAKTKQYLLGFTIGQGITCSMSVMEGEQGSFYYAWDVH